MEKKSFRRSPLLFILRKKRNSWPLWGNSLFLFVCLFVLFFLSLQSQLPGNPSEAAVAAKQIAKTLKERNSYLWSEKLWSQGYPHCFFFFLVPLAAHYWRHIVMGSVELKCGFLAKGRGRKTSGIQKEQGRITERRELKKTIA